MKTIKKAICLVLTLLILVPAIVAAPAALAFGGQSSTVSAGSGHTMAIDTGGILWAWGDNSQGQLGDGTLISRRSPVQIMDNVSMVSAGDRYNFAIRTDGTLWAWGQNDRGQLGDGTAINRRTPVKIMEDVIYASAGWKRTDGGLADGVDDFIDVNNVPETGLLWQHSLAVTSDGTLWAWGDNNAGQLGDETLVNRHSPVRVMEDVVSVSAGNMFTMAVRSDGSLWAWGQNDRGQFGIGTIVGSRIPIKIMEDVSEVYAGDSYAMIIRTDGSLWAMGQNDRGQFGNGNRVSSRVPLRLKENVISLAASGNHTMALMSDGSLWAWGQNDRGQFGNNTTINSNIPVRITDGVVAVSAGDKFTVAIREDGTLWTWGLNNRGQLGNGSAVNSFSPVRIMANILQPDLIPRTAPPSITAPIADIRVVLDGTTLRLDTPPMTIDGRTLVPLRGIFTAMGAEVNWNPDTLEIEAVRGDTTISLTVGSNVLIRNGQNIQLEVPAIVMDGRTMVPARAIAESFGAEVHWDSGTRTVVITDEL